MSLNKVMLIGNLGNDPEIRYTNSGDAVTNATLATNKKYRDKSNNLVDKTEWHRLVFFKQLAETVAKHLTKGSLIYVEGEIQTAKWQDKDGKDRYTTDIICKEMKMLGGKNAENNSNNNQSSKTTQVSNEGAPDIEDIPF
jgi:single-strand DNA-binding protein